MKPHLYATYSENQRRLYDNCLLPTAGEFEVHAKAVTGPGGEWGTPAFARVSRLKAQHILGGLQDHPGEVIVWSDNDVVIFKDIYAEMVELLGKSSLIASPAQHYLRGPRWTTNINTGFMAIRSTPKTIAMYEEVIDLINEEKNRYDQWYTNQVLQARRIDFRRLPLKYFHTGLVQKGLNKLVQPPEGITMFHGTFMRNDAVKEKLLLHMKEHVEHLGSDPNPAPIPNPLPLRADGSRIPKTQNRKKR